MEVSMGRFFFILVMIVSVAVIPMVREAEANLSQPNLDVYDEWYDSAVGLTYKVTNNGQAGTIWAIFIGAKTPIGSLINPVSDLAGWGAMVLTLKTDWYQPAGALQPSPSLDAYNESILVLKGLTPSLWQPSEVGQYQYTSGYLFWAIIPTTGTAPGIAVNSYGDFYVNGGTSGSPWAEVHQQPIDPNTEKTYTHINDSGQTVIDAPPGYGVSFEGLTHPGTGPAPPRPVPLPSALLLLGPGLVGLAAVKRKIKK
jgi:hypothetical protein